MVSNYIILTAIENHIFLIGKPSINGPFSIAMLVYQRVYIYVKVYDYMISMVIMIVMTTMIIMLI